MRRLADALGIDCSPDDIEALATAASFGSMKERAHQVAPNSDLAIWRDTSEFFHRGSSGQWQELFGPEHLRRYDERIAELDDQALVSWIHGGWGAVASASDVTYPPAPRTAATDPAPPSAGAARHR
jgi:hypothetical protein